MRRCTGPYLSHACNTGRARRSISFDICRCAFRIAERLRWGQISVFGRAAENELTPLPVAEPGPVTENPRTRMSGYRGYVELVRPANVATALADVLAGYAVAGQGDPRPVLPSGLAAPVDGLPLCRRGCPQRRLRPRPRSNRTARAANSERTRVDDSGRRPRQWPPCRRNPGGDRLPRPLPGSLPGRRRPASCSTTPGGNGRGCSGR